MSPDETDDALEFYSTPGRFTTLGPDAFASDDINRVVEVVQGLLVYDVVAQPFYGVDLDAVQADAIHERDTARYLAIAQALDARPLGGRGSSSGRASRAWAIAR